MTADYHPTPQFNFSPSYPGTPVSQPFDTVSHGTHPFSSSSSDVPSSPPPHNPGSLPPLPPLHPPSQQGATPFNPLIVDTIARDFCLEQDQVQLLRTFVRLGHLGPGLSLPDLATRVFLLAAQLGEAAEKRRAEQEQRQEMVDYRVIWRDLKLRLEETFCFTRQQKQNIRGVVQDQIYNGSRTKFLTMHADVLNVLEQRKSQLSLENIYGVPGREKSLSQLVKRQCSSVRNGWRADLISSIDPKKFIPLADFVYEAVTKYRTGGAGGDIPQVYKIHAVLLRRFVFDHPSLKRASAEDEEPESDAEYDEAEQRRPRKKAKTGKVPKGENFWGRVDQWFKKQVEERGISLTGPKWKSYVDQLIKDDAAKFKGIIPGSPSNEENTPPAGVLEGSQVPSSSGMVGGGDMSASSATGQMLHMWQLGGQQGQ
ncbi:hypothetical protein R3P38DRAFT_3503251 [Favolaschia claudopus]|uniref:Uncharacterized protein n=1 Tax=Favolaschia claudopus TaxID=2862362 RepID=A0AAW0C3Y5_9AGAR